MHSSAYAPLLIISMIACHDPSANDPNAGRGPLGKADLAGTCVGTDCNGQSDSACWCDELCEGYGDCCADKVEVCGQHPLVFTVQPLTDNGNDPQVALDPAGVPHVSFYRYLSNGGTVRFASPTLGASSSESTSVSPGLTMGPQTWLTFDADAQPHVLYRGREGFRTMLKHATRVGTTWQIENIDAETDVDSNSDSRGLYPSLAIGPDGVLHAASMRDDIDSESFVELRHYWRDATGWQLEVVATIRGNFEVGGMRLSNLAIDDVGVLHLAYAKPKDGTIYYARKDAVGWTVERITTFEDSVPVEPSLAVTGDGVAHVAFVAGPNGERRVFHAVRNNASWSTSIVGSELGGAGINAVALTLDDGGTAHLAFQAGEYRHLYWARANGSSITVQAVDEGNGVGETPSIAVGAGTDPAIYIGYRDHNLGLRLAHTR